MKEKQIAKFGFKILFSVVIVVIAGIIGKKVALTLENDVWLWFLGCEFLVGMGLVLYYGGFIKEDIEGDDEI